MLIIFVLIAVGLTACAALIVLRPLQQGADSRTALALGLALPACVLLLYLLVSNHDWSNPPVRAAAPQSAGGMPDINAMIAQLEARLAAEPDDLDGWLMLGRTYVQLGRPADSLRAYRRALALAPVNEARLGAAEAQIMLDRNTLNGEAGQLIETVLAEEPDNMKALFYGGLVALARQDAGQVRARWEKLLQLSPPAEIRSVIESQLRQLEPRESGAAAAGVQVSVTVDPNIAERIDPSAVLYLVARDPQRPGPPVAVIRRNAAELPATLTITDGDAMLPGASLSALRQIRLIARVANRGNPVAEAGDLFGELTLEQAQFSAEGHAIVIDQVVE